jgi:hypothetical protein
MRAAVALAVVDFHPVWPFLAGPADVGYRRGRAEAALEAAGFHPRSMRLQDFPRQQNYLDYSYPS